MMFTFFDRLSVKRQESEKLQVYHNFFLTYYGRLLN